MDVGRNRCSRCKHRRGDLVPCEWLKGQASLVLNCQYFEEDEGEQTVHTYHCKEDVYKLYFLLQDSTCPAWIWFPNNAEMLKLAEYLVARGVTCQAERSGNWSLRCDARKGYMDEVDEVFYLECSECRRKVWDINQGDAMMGNWEKLIEPFPYCHCGAKMHQEVKDDGE